MVMVGLGLYSPASRPVTAVDPEKGDGCCEGPLGV